MGDTDAGRTEPAHLVGIGPDAVRDPRPVGAPPDILEQVDAAAAVPRE